MKKRAVYLLGLVTLLVFPIPTFFFLQVFEDIDWKEILEFDRISVLNIGLGLQLGFLYALFALLLLRSPIFDSLPGNVERVVRSMKLSVLDSIFLSFCAGFGEELLFRSGLQFYIHPVLCSIIFIAIHGYFNPMNWKISLYGFILFPFILLLSYGFYEFGLWFAIAAHFCYDLVIFLSIRKG